MKKTLIALAVAAVAATSANATVVYQKDGAKIDIDGRLHFELRNDKDNRTDLRDVGSRLRVRAYQEIGAGFSAYGGVELRFSKDNGNANSIGSDFRTHRLYAGLIHKDIGTLTFGSQLHLGDHIPKANYTYDWGGNVFFDSHKKAAHFMSAKFAGVRFAADYYFGSSNKDKSSGAGSAKNAGVPTGGTAWNEGQGYGLGLFYDGQFGDVAVRFGSGYTEVTQSNNGTKANEFKLKRAGVGFDVKYNIVTLGFDWAYGKASKDQETDHIGFQKIANAGGPFNSNNRFLVGLKVNVTPQNALYSQYYFGTAKKAAPAAEKVKMCGWMIGADHKFNKYVSVYLEGGTGKVKQGGTELKKNHRVLVGARVMF
ncbi:porin [Canicola haemoglobinophilus]|uniref:Porin n=1 Tax=Canicola haemoglobinophilus TaxID=733 RepID=A0AB38H710_9PAST|nr:porin [Canicola haemoglobinophilus]STO55425.1 porin [Canicola haemoglobinophilus]STO67753.1 porin [Canicola haemoglobinophilus]